MNLLNCLLILTIQPAAPTTDGSAEAVEVFHCGFEQETDQNYDLWPDDWVRRVGRGYPQYLKVAIFEDQRQGAPLDKRCLRLELDGGAATVYSPPIPISPQFSYVLSGKLKTENLIHDVAYYSLEFFDEAGKETESYESAKVRNQSDWKRSKIGPVTPSRAGATTAIIGVHLRPTKKTDLVGSAMFDDIRLTRLPRMALRSNRQHNVYTDPSEIEITCEVSGIQKLDPQLRLELLDVDGQVVAEMTKALQAESQPGHIADAGQKSGFSGIVTWNPPMDRGGFYRVRSSMQGHTELLLQREITLALVRDQRQLGAGEFGWSLPQGENPLTLKSLASLLSQAGVNWVKFPVWYSGQDGTWADRTAEFVERLSTNKIELIGVLDQPPADSRQHFGGTDRLPVASVFVEPELWRPIVDPVMTRLSMKVRWWQLGRDDDTSFIGFADLEQRIADIKEHLEKFGQEIYLGIGWQWLYEMPADNSPPWHFLSFTEAPPFTDHELQYHLDKDYSKPTKRWIILEPLPQHQYSLASRVRDLVTRMLAAKKHGADAIFIPDPFDPERGLMKPDGTPAELFLPWRTTSQMLAGKSYLGSIRLPGGSENHIFSRGAETVMVVWNDQPTNESVFLGHDVHQIDVWGRRWRPDQDGHRQVIQVGRLPMIVTGLNRSVALWRMSFAFDDQPLKSIFGHPQTTSFRFTNTFQQGVGGKLELHTPDMWGTAKEFALKLAAGANLIKPFDVVLNSNARTGDQIVRVDFEITADRTYQFSVYRTMQVGLGDVIIEVHTSLNGDGNLVVTQNLINKTDEFVSFDCLLFAPHHRRQRIQVLNLGRGRNTQTFFFPQGEQLIGKTLWLRAEEIGGQRVLNYHVTVER